MDDISLMRAALEAAAGNPDEVPVGAVVARGGQIVAAAANAQAGRNDPLAHAEMLALAAAREALGTGRLDGCEMFVTLEPCPMCAGAILLSGVSRLVFGAFDTQYGCCGSVYALPMDPVFHRFVACEGGLLQDEAKALLDAFFGRIRGKGPGENPPAAWLEV
ncbi:MAG TPA: nucleoside deaminase [Candidatus Limnocylindria bacterium]|nr:nucleoside deaminase [Candidatus Limnocylindria bacterium]